MDSAIVRRSHEYAIFEEGTNRLIAFQMPSFLFKSTVQPHERCIRSDIQEEIECTQSSRNGTNDNRTSTTSTTTTKTTNCTAAISNEALSTRVVDLTHEATASNTLQLALPIVQAQYLPLELQCDDNDTSDRIARTADAHTAAIEAPMTDTSANGNNKRKRAASNSATKRKRAKRATDPTATTGATTMPSPPHDDAAAPTQAPRVVLPWNRQQQQAQQTTVGDAQQYTEAAPESISNEKLTTASASMTAQVIEQIATQEQQQPEQQRAIEIVEQQARIVHLEAQIQFHKHQVRLIGMPPCGCCRH
jgi:hypothetical protein